MIKAALLRHLLQDEAVATQLRELYGEIEPARKRIGELFTRVDGLYSPKELRLFSAPGRAELGGNHTDHNGGKVLAASVHLDSLALVEATSGNLVELHSEGYDVPFRVDLDHLEKVPAEAGKTEALIRGIAAHLTRLGRKVGGFRGCITSNVLPGSGLSSSASIEMLIGTIFSHLFNDGGVSILDLSLAGQFAENEYFEKPCGLMDQMACGSGGIVAIDFERSASPVVRQVKTDFAGYGYSLVVTDTGGSHADLTPDYAAVPAEMRAVAQYFGKSVCRELDPSRVLAAIPELRTRVGDRAILRALHFFADNRRVDHQLEALEEGHFEAYLRAVREAGDSSWELLQNNYPPSKVSEQGVPLALALSRLALGDTGAVRIQGGGFAGTMQAYLPTERLTDYVGTMEGYFGPGCSTQIRIRNIGTTELFSEVAR